MIAAEHFRAVIRGAGLHPPEIIEADGKLHRFSSSGERGDDAGWYVYYHDGIPAGAFGDWRTGISQTWRADVGRKLSPQEQAAHRAKIVAMQRERKVEERARRAEAAKKALALWKAATPARADHPYLTNKRVSPVATLREIDADAAAAILGYAPKAKDELLTGRLLIAPVKIGDVFSTAEIIDETGRKSAVAGGAKAGGYWAAKLPSGETTLLIGEGIATVLSARQATGHPVIAALSAGNLPAIAKVMRERYPGARLVILADLVKASGAPDPHAVKAARSVGGLVAVPDFGTERPEGATDFNDLLLRCGQEAVKRAIETASAPTMTDVHSTVGTVLENDPAGRIVYRRASDIQAKPIRWLWQGRIARGKVSILAGHPGLGKSQVSPIAI